MQILTTLLIVFCFSFIAIKLLKPIATKFGLVDKPNKQRKHHIGSIPIVGGLSIYCGLIAGNLYNPELLNFNYVVSAGLIVVIGAFDDRKDLSVIFRICGQALATSIMIFTYKIYLQDLGDILFFTNLNLGLFGIIITYLAVIGCINAFNMIDGIDGLIGCVTISTMFGISILLFLANQYQAMTFTLSILVSIIPYLIFNLTRIDNPKRRKIFMGDAGSMFIGLTVVWLLIQHTQGINKAFNPVVALWFIALPLIDMIGVIIRRLKKGKSPFKPDRDHLHHILLNQGLSEKQTLIVLSFFSFFMVFIGILFEINNIHDTISFTCFILFFIMYLIFQAKPKLITNYFTKQSNINETK